MRRTTLTLLAALLALPAPGRPAGAQVKEVVVGGVAGVAAGAGITLAMVVARARLQDYYLDSAEDVIHGRITPLIAAPAAGVLLGLAGENVLKGSIVGSASGLAIGMVAGAGLGWLVSESPEWPWAGGVIGGGLGLTVGALYGAIRAWTDDAAPGGGDEPVAAIIGVRVAR